MQRALIHLALRHDEVLGRRDQRVHANVTQIDVHDFCRLTKTYGLGGFHVVTSMPSQHRITGEILRYWNEGAGRDYNQDRHQALQLLRLHENESQLMASIAVVDEAPPLVIATSAKRDFPEKTLEFEQWPAIIEGSDRPVLLQFGTSWGLSPEQIDRCDWVLAPIEGHDGYNHLSVRCAAAILVDRLCRTLP